MHLYLTIGSMKKAFGAMAPFGTISATEQRYWGSSGLRVEEVLPFLIDVLYGSYRIRLGRPDDLSSAPRSAGTPVEALPNFALR